MDHQILLLSGTAFTIGLLHTLMGPDHYLPFVMMARARAWTNRKLFWITTLCGIGHVLGSIVLGAVGIAIGVAVGQLEGIESVRGDLAAWGLTAFGLIYLVWGIRAAWRNQPHQHIHFHEDGSQHIHEHVHMDEHSHAHDLVARKNITPWILFTIFVLGPCEPLIPILMYPAAKSSLAGMTIVATVFGVTTVSTMLASVFLLTRGIDLLPLNVMERYAHALAGGAISLCGMAMLLGL